MGIHKYDFLRSLFTFIDVNTQSFPDYLESVPTLLVDKNMIKGDDVFGYMNSMVEEIIQKNPSLGQDIQQSTPPSNQVSSDPVDDLVGWCPDGGCTFSDITEQNDDCAKQSVSTADTTLSFISEENDSLSTPHSKIGIETTNEQYQSSEKRQQMDASYERLMSERDLIK